MERGRWNRMSRIIMHIKEIDFEGNVLNFGEEKTNICVLKTKKRICSTNFSFGNGDKTEGLD